MLCWVPKEQKGLLSLTSVRPTSLRLRLRRSLELSAPFCASAASPPHQGWLSAQPSIWGLTFIRKSVTVEMLQSAPAECPLLCCSVPLPAPPTVCCCRSLVADLSV